MDSDQLAARPSRRRTAERATMEGERTDWSGYLRAGTMFLLAYIGFFFVSKLIGFTTGYALDDYVIVRQGGLANQTEFFISQGRYGSALMEAILHACNLTMSSFSTIGLAATALFSGLFYRDALRLPERGSPLLAIGLGALLGAHPYYTEYVSFRQAALPMSLVFLGMWVALQLYVKAFQPGSNRIHVLMGSLVVATLVMGVNQLAVSFMAIAVLCVHVRRLQNGELATAGTSLIGRQAWLVPLFHAAITGAVLIACNLVVAKLMLAAFGISSNQRTALVASDMLIQRGHELAGLLPTLWAKSETVASWPAKALAMVAFLVLLVSNRFGQKRYTWLALLTFFAATAAALIPVTASGVWWPMPRTLIAVPFALAAAIAVLIPTASLRFSWPGMLLVASGCIFAAHSQSILFNQQRLNRWDQMQARDISQLAAVRFPEVASKLAIVGPTWAHDVAQTITQGDLNVSALATSWAVDPLFDEATGRDQEVRIAPEFDELCASSPKYPDPASLHREQDEVVVCMH